jgi:hypothetical protein
MGADGLEVEELLGIDVREASRLPRLRQVAGRERGALSAVVPAPEGGDEDGSAQFGAALDSKVLADPRSLRQRYSPSEHEPGGERDDS